MTLQRVRIPRLLATTALAVVLAALIVPGIAMAADPPTSQQLVYYEDFESSLGAEWDVGPFALIPPPPDWWGRLEGQRYRSGTWALWCAGSPGGEWPSYSYSSAGYAHLLMPELADYYSATYELYYTQRTLGVADGYAFTVGWINDGGIFGEFRSGFPTTAKNQFVKLSYDVTDPSHLNLSRTPGYLYVEWFDAAETLEETPKIGEGPTVDDVSVYAYTYGPVRSLTSGDNGTRVTLDWQTPYAATGSSQVDTRTVNYRVWRSPGVSPPYTWTDLTGGSRISATDYVDNTSVANAAYTYAVQAWDPGSGTGYGELRLVTAGFGVLPEPEVTITKAASKSEMLAGQSVRYYYTVENSGNTTLTAIAVTDDQIGTVGTIDELGPGDSTLVNSAATTLYETTTNIGYATGTYEASPGEYDTVSDASNSVTVDVYDPSVKLTKTANQSVVAPGTTVRYKFTVKNNGDVRLENMQVTDPAIGYTSSTFALDPGDSTDLYVDKKLQATLTNTAEVSGDFVHPPLSTTVTDQDSVTVTVQTASSAVVERISGQTRVDTAIAMSKKAFPAGGADTVVIATAYGWADALPAAALAGAKNAPLLLVEQNALPSAVRSEIVRLGASSAYIVGGTAVVSNSVASAIDAVPGMAAPRRLGGTNRYGTAELVGKEVKAVTGAYPATVFVATGLNFPDALAASSIAAAGRWPILLTERDALPDNTRMALAALNPTTIVICGGTGVVSGAVESQLRAYGSVVRKGGVDRYATGDLIVRWGETALGTPSPTGGYAATGQNYPDALAGGPLAGGIGAGGGQWRPLLLTEPGSLTPAVASYLAANPSIKYIGVLGGTGAVSTTVENQLRAAIQ